MLEIVVVYLLCRKCSRTARAKGYTGGWFGFMAAALWFGLELIGAVAGVFITMEAGLAAYAFGLAGAGVGAGISLVIIRLLRPRAVVPTHTTAAGEPSRPLPSPPPAAPRTAAYCHRCGTPIPEGGRYCVKCGTPAQGA